MKQVKRGTMVLGMLLAGTGNVWAAQGARHDNSGIIVWAFLGLCALIVVAQLVPALMMLFGFVKALGSKREKEVQVAESTANEG